MICVRTFTVTEDLIAAGYTETQAYVMVYSGGLSIFSAMDPDIQAICDSVASDESLYPDGTRWLLSYQLTYRDPDSEEEGGIVNISSEKYKSYYQENGDKNFNLLYSSQEESTEESPPTSRLAVWILRYKLSVSASASSYCAWVI